MTDRFEENQRNQIVVHVGRCTRGLQESLRASIQITNGRITLIQHNLSLLPIASPRLLRGGF
jgi:hypothetical protein